MNAEYAALLERTAERTNSPVLMLAATVERLSDRVAVLEEIVARLVKERERA